jgi:hypothetical protein
MSSNFTSETITDPQALKPQDRWEAEIVAAEKAQDKFLQRARRVTRRFLDERDAVQTTATWFNVFYANVVNLEAALYARLPKPSVTRRFKDFQDDTARVAALIIERSITQDLDDPRDTFDSTMRQCVQDRLVPGLSQAWLRLETDTEDIEGVEADDIVGLTPQPDMETEEVGGQETPAEKKAPQRITDQRVVVDYIFWEDFLWSPCRIWDERRWVGRKVYMSREELVDRFGAEKGNRVPLKVTSRSLSDNVQPSTPKEDILKKATVYELWERGTRKVFWVAKGMDDVLDEVDDPLGLVGFEPCPRPMLANISTSDMTPRPDYFMIQDQYQELDAVNNRISMLVKACKVVGVYDKAAGGVQRMLQEGVDNTLIPVDNWNQFAEKNGLKGQIDWMPLEQVIKALDQLNRSREVIKAQIYELTGIADIVRGASKASETLGAQEIKAQFAGVRIQKLQNEVARFAGDILRIKAEMQVKHFTPEIMIQKSNIMATGNDEWIAPALEMLATDEGFEWRIQVTADSIAQADYQMEKQDRIEFMTSVTGFLEQTSQIVQTSPDSLPMLLTMLKWSVAGFRNAAELEGMIDKELDAAMLKVKQPKPAPPPTPEQIKAQAEQQKMQQQMQIDEATAQREAAQAQQEAALEQQRQEMDMRAEQQRQAMDLEFERMRQEMEAESQRRELAFQEAMAAIKLAAQVDMNEAKLDAAKAQAEAKPKETTSGKK